MRDYAGKCRKMRERPTRGFPFQMAENAGKFRHLHREAMQIITNRREIVKMVTMREWDRKQTARRYAEYLRMKLLYTGHAETNFLAFDYDKCQKTVTIRTALESVTVTCEKFRKIQWKLYMLDAAENLPLLCDNRERKSVGWNRVLPKYGPKEQTLAEKYAERLRQDKWDVRRNGDPCNWRLASY